MYSMHHIASAFGARPIGSSWNLECCEEVIFVSVRFPSKFFNLPSSKIKIKIKQSYFLKKFHFYYDQSLKLRYQKELQFKTMDPK